ncbi:MAG: YicC family protein [Verrucomicrobia bacterium]|nr:YicC family protein [Verrucomicrobiota bacterium]
MTRSMTAYSRATSSEIEGLKWNVEIQSINRKGLDINLYLPRDLLFIDVEIRKLIGQALQRGQVTVRINLEKEKEAGAALPQLKKLKSQWEKMAKELGFAKEEITLAFILAQMEQASSNLFGPKVQAELKKTVGSALDGLIKMKETEGKALAADILKRIKVLKDNVNTMEKLSAKAPELYREKLLKRLEILLKEPLEDERALREVALFAEKADITEEITRLKSHFAQFSDQLKSKGESIGRTLDFLIQEILREINTISSKSADLALTQLAVGSKAELEKIREQVQNIE